MTAHEEFVLSDDPAPALLALKASSADGARVLVFKKSPICPVSHRAEQEFRGWLADRNDGVAIKVTFVDVIAEKPLARGLTAALGIDHQSPQALLFAEGELIWHESHAGINRRSLAEHVDSTR